jgi:hypothetical protein
MNVVFVLGLWGMNQIVVQIVREHYLEMQWRINAVHVIRIAPMTVYRIVVFAKNQVFVKQIVMENLIVVQ